MPECELLETCGLFKKYQPTEELACRWFIDRYCTRREMANCRRKRHYLRYGTLPSDDMLPTGVVVKDATESEQLLARL